MRRPDTGDLKYQARTLLNGKYGTLALVTLIMAVSDIVLTYILAYTAPADNSIFGLILYIASMVLCNMISYILLAGLMRLYLNICRGCPYKITTIFSFFSEHPEQIALYSIVQFLLQNGASFLWGKYFPALWSWETGFSFSLKPVLILLILGIIYIWIQLCLSMVLFRYCDYPWKTAVQLIAESWHLIRGNRGRFLYMTVSFAGVGLLCLLSLGIGFLFVRPYYYMTQSLFYLQLISRDTPDDVQEDFFEDIPEDVPGEVL